MCITEILLLFVVSVTVIISLILDSVEKNNKTRHEQEQSSTVLDFENKTQTESFVNESVNPIHDHDQQQAKKEIVEEKDETESPVPEKEIVEEKDETESPVPEISERSNFYSERYEFFDDWEGIERTELEKVFGKAVVFVSNADRFNEELKLQLYGLQKVALEGPCHESQPMALKVSARSKWNAWEKLGNMSREMAMENYIEILSMAVPDWKGEVVKPIQDSEVTK